MDQPAARVAYEFGERDPFFDVPLARNARYIALAERLEAQMSRTEL